MVNKDPSQRTGDAKARNAALKRRATGFSLGLLLAAFGAVAASGTPGAGASPTPDPFVSAAASSSTVGATNGAPAARAQAPNPQGSATGLLPATAPPSSSLARPGGSAARPAAPVRRARSRMS